MDGFITLTGIAAPIVFHAATSVLGLQALRAAASPLSAGQGETSSAEETSATVAVQGR
jgi:hypothetical protein